MTEAEVRGIAQMARLRLDDERVRCMQTELCKVLGWAAMLKEVDAEDLGEDRYPDRVRIGADEPGAMLDRAALEAMAPATDGPFVRVPKVLGGGGGA